MTRTFLAASHPVVAAAASLGCRWAGLPCERAYALSLSHRTDTRSAADARAGVWLLSRGFQRRAPSSRRGVSRRNEVLRYRDSAPGHHRGEDHGRAELACRGAQCGIGAVGQRFTSGVAQLLRLSHREAQGPQGWPATDEVEEGSSAIVSADAQRFQSPAQRSVICGEGGRGAGALVARSAQRAFLSHDHSRAGWPFLRQLCRRGAAVVFAGGRSGGRGGCGDHPVGDDRRHRWGAHRHCEPEALGAQAAETSPSGAREIPTTERVKQQRQNPAHGRYSTRRGSSCSAGLSPQTGFGVSSRQSSDPRRRPQHRWNAPKSSARAGDLRCGVGAVCADHRRESRPLRALHVHGVALAGFEQDLLQMRVPTRRTASGDPRVDMPIVSGYTRSRPQRRQGRSRRRAGGETKHLLRKWAGPRQRFRWSPRKTATHCGGGQ
jgi:hypothetical protein